MLEELVRQINSLQRKVDGLIKPEVGRWIDWTPTITQGVGVAITINYSRYIVDEANKVTVQARITATGTGTAGSIIQIGGIPAAVDSKQTGINAVIGTVIITDSGGVSYHAALIATSSATWQMLVHNTLNYVGANVTITSGASISFHATYEK